MFQPRSPPPQQPPAFRMPPPVRKPLAKSKVEDDLEKSLQEAKKLLGKE